MGLREVRLVEAGTGTRERASLVIGIDESGDYSRGGDPFVFVAVQCPRENGERLAELLISSGLKPWQAKAQSLSLEVEPGEQLARVDTFIESIEDTPISWSAAAGWNEYTVSERAAAACTVASRTITRSHTNAGPVRSGRAVLLHDGGLNTYGSNLSTLRGQAMTVFDSAFQTQMISTFVTAFPKADYSYPEVIAADHIAWYLRYCLTRGDASVGTLPSPVDRISPQWRDDPPGKVPLYHLQTSDAGRERSIDARIVAWITGRRPPTEDALSSASRLDPRLQQLGSETIRTYVSGIDEC